MMNQLLLRELTTSVPKGFVGDLLRSVDWSYGQAHDATHKDPLLGGPEAEYLEPHYRRCILERRLQDIARLHNLKAHVATVESNGYQYTELFAGRMLLTLIHASSTWKIVRESSFRQADAKLNKLLDQQEFDFGLHVQDSLGDGVDLNAVIYHGTDFRNPYKAGFVKVGFPSSGNARWAYRIDGYDLLAAYPIEQATPEDQDLIITWKRKSGEAVS